MKTLLSLLSIFTLCFAQIVPFENRIEWTPGLHNSDRDSLTTILYIVTDFDADNSGNSDVLAVVKSAIASLSSTGGVIYFPEGTYRFDGTLEINRDNITLRGEGADKTQFHFYNPEKSACIYIVTYGRGDWQTVSGYMKDATRLTVADGSAFTVGEFAEIQQENDSAFMYTSPLWNQSFAHNSVGQFMEISAINGNEITLKTPLHLGFKAQFNPQVRDQRLIKNVTVENLYIEMKTDSDVNTIMYKNAAYGLVKNIVSYHTRKAHVHSESTIGGEVRDSKFSRSFDYGGGGHGYGVSLGFHTTDWLVENNRFDSLRHAMIFSKGANGNVFGYNYSQNVLQGEGETNLNDGWTPPDLSNHGHYAFMNLIEGNSLQEMGISDHWGPSGPGNLYFRNRVLSDETPDGISYYDVSTKQNVIGNSALKIRDADGNAFDNLEHGNLINGELLWDETIAEHSLESSYYLSEKPSFFNTQPWPIYGPVEGFDEKLPAQILFEGGEVSLRTSAAVTMKQIVTHVQQGNKIKIKSSEPFTTISLYSVSGKELFSHAVNSEYHYEINSSSIATGVYFIMLNGVSQVVQKISIK